jgi:hypothetical protein
VVVTSIRAAGAGLAASPAATRGAAAIASRARARMCLNVSPMDISDLSAVNFAFS